MTDANGDKVLIINAVPEPAMVLLGTGLVGLGLVRRAVKPLDHSNGWTSRRNTSGAASSGAASPFLCSRTAQLIDPRPARATSPKRARQGEPGSSSSNGAPQRRMADHCVPHAIPRWQVACR